MSIIQYEPVHIGDFSSFIENLVSKTKYLNNPSLYSELHKLDERKEEIQKLVDNSN